MCLFFRCGRCHHVNCDRCDDARRPSNLGIDPRTCQNVDWEGSQRRKCGLCRTLDEASHRLDFWIRTQGGERLVTEGGAAEEMSSPPRADDDQGVHQEQPQQPQVPHVTDTFNRRAADDYAQGDEADDEKEPINLDYLDLNKLRPLSGSTVGSSSTAPTAFGSSAVRSKRESTGKPQETAASLGDADVNTPLQAHKVRHVSNPCTDYSIGPAAATLHHFHTENAPIEQPSTTMVEGQTVQPNPTVSYPILPTTEQYAEESNNAPLNIGALKRTISTLTFDDLTPGTRTACPPFEANDTPPAYARPRSEVGLPPLLPDVKEGTEIEDAAEGDENDTVERSRSGFRPRGRSRERTISAQNT